MTDGRQHGTAASPKSAKHRGGRLRRPALAALLTLGLAGALEGCDGNGGDAELKNYVTRLSRPLDGAFATPEDTPGPSPPRAEALRLDIEGSAVDGLDFLELKGCALQTTIARRNSSLGRVAPPSQRLLLDLAFLREAPACIDTLGARGNTGLAGLLREAAKLKRAQLPALIFNATLGGTEYRDFWRARRVDSRYPDTTGSAVITALEHIDDAARRWLEDDYDADDRRFELALGDIARGDGGELVRTLGRQQAWLSAANAMITASLDAGPLCAFGRTPAAAPILRTVVRKFFIGEVQPRAAALNQRDNALLPPLLALEQRLRSVLPQSYRVWRRTRRAFLEEARDAPALHVRRLQSLLGSCYAEFRTEDTDADVRVMQ